MENTYENKAKFFAQYLGQEVLWGYVGQINNDLSIVKKLSHNHLDTSYLEHFFHSEQKASPILLLKNMWNLTIEDFLHISNLTEGRKIEIDKISVNDSTSLTIDYHFTDYPENKENIRGKKSHFPFPIWNHGSRCRSPFYTVAVGDYLRSQGYAIEFNGLSVNKLVEYGWVKLR